MAVSTLEKKELLSDYCVLGGSKQNRLSDVERMTLVGGEDLVKLLRRVSRETGAVNVDSIIQSIDPNHLEQVGKFYRSFSDTQEIFKKPQGIISPKIIPVHGLSDSGEICDLEFESCFDGLHPSFQTLKTAIPENKKITVRYWKHKESKRPTIVAVHGFAMGDHKINSLAFLPGLFFRLGFDIALMELPFHGRRLAPEVRDAGHTFFPGSNLFLTNEGILQAVSDLRQLRLVLKALGSGPVGCMGISLGAYITSLWATLDKLPFCIPMVPLVSMPDIIKRTLEIRHNMPCPSEILEGMEGALQVHQAASYSSATTPDSVLIVAGKGDSVIPESQPKALSAHFGGCGIEWFSGDHGMSEDRDFIFNSILEFFKKLSFL